MSVKFAVPAWSGWRESDGATALIADDKVNCAAQPDVSVIPPMLRRRLNLLGRACASLALPLISEHGRMPIVYCSQHGDIERTTKVLQELVANEPVSPMHFSLAVHNAVCGVISIQTGLTEPVSALATDQGAIVPVLLEALGLLDAGHDRVLCTICDVKLPEIYVENDAPAGTPHAIAFIIDQSPESSLQINQLAGLPETGNVLSNALEFLTFLSSDAPACLIEHNATVWQISRTG